MQEITAGVGPFEATEGETPNPGSLALETYQAVAEARIDLESLIEQEKINLAKYSFPHFIEYVIRDSANGKPIHLAPIHLEWCRHIQTYLRSPYDIGVLAPWGHGKSQIVAIALSLWLIGWNRNLRIGIICNSDNNASKRIVSIGDYVKKSEAYHAVFPHVRPGKDKSWNEHRLVVERDVIAQEGTVEAAGIDSAGTGSRFDVMIFDDPVDEKDANSETVRNSRIEKYSNVWSSRVEPHGKTFYIATRWHKHDLTNEIMQKENWRFIVQAVTDDFTGYIQPPRIYDEYPAVVGKDEPKKIGLWETKWPERILRDRQIRHGLRAYARGFQQKPYSDEDRLFSEEHVYKMLLWDVSVQDAIPDDWPKFLGADLSSDKRPGTSITVIARDPKTGRKVIAETTRGAWGWSSRTAARIYDMFFKWDCRVGFVENNAAQEAMLALVKEIYGRDIPLKGYTTGKQKADPIDGLPGLAIQIENDAWSFPLKHVRKERKYLGTSEVSEIVLIRELLEYPQGLTTDSLMSLWFANHASNMGLKFVKPDVFHGDGKYGRQFGGRSNIFGMGYKKERGGVK